MASKIVGTESGPSSTLVAVAVPLAGASLAYLLWWASDRLVIIGPLDRATFGWLVVIPVWALTPFAAALAWRAIDTRSVLRVAAVTGLLMSAAAALLFWLAPASSLCDNDAVRTAAASILPALVVGLTVGAGFAAACLAATVLLRQGWSSSAFLVGAGSAIALVLLAAVIATSLVMGGGGCQPMPV